VYLIWHGGERTEREECMSPWRGEANCPKCGGEGTLLVTGETAMIEIEGCWVCGYGRGDHRPPAEFVPLARLKVVEEKRGPKGRR
jgi:hypothetical protein